MLSVVQYYFAVFATFALISSSPINEDQVYTLNEKPLHPEKSTNSDQNLSLSEESNVSRVDDSIPLIVFEANNGNHSDIDDCNTSYNGDCSNDRDLEVDLIGSNELESLQEEETEPNNGDQIQLKTTNGDSDTVFFISNTEVKMLDINPTEQRESALSVENFSIDMPENFTGVEALKEERQGNFINTPIVHFINKMNRHNFSAIQMDEKPNATMQEIYGNITTLTVIDESAGGENIFSGLSDFQTVTVAGLMTIVPLILSTVFVIAIGFGCRFLWQKYKREYDSGSVLLGETNSEIPPGKLVEQGGPLDQRKLSNVAEEKATEPAEEKSVYRNGSIIKMTMQNNHLIVETEERNDISNDARETKLSYSSEKDGIFVVESTCGANQLNGSIHKKTNNLVKASQQSILESNLNLDEGIQVHSPPTSPPRPKTGLSQSTVSLHSSSTDSNHNYQYGGCRYYQVVEDYRHKFTPAELVMAATAGSRTQSSETEFEISSSVSDRSYGPATASVDEK